MKEKLLDIAHEIATDLHEADAISTQTMREFNLQCLSPVEKYSASKIKRIRLHNKVSQAVFAAYLNTSPSTVRQWEQGLKKPAGISLKMLNLIEHHGLLYIAA